MAAAPTGVAAESHVHDHGRMAAPERAIQTELGADAAFDAQGALWAVHKVSGHIAVSRSADRGQTWSSPVLVTPAPEMTDAGGDARPKIAVAGSGEIYVTWTRPLDEPFTGEIRFSRSLDRGRTFLPPVIVHRDRQIITHRFDTMAVNDRGQLFVAWIDKRDLVAATKAGGEPYRGAAVYFAVSDDRGASFRGDYKVADHSCECCRIALTPGAAGTVVAMWRHIFAPNIRDHAIASLRPDGTAGAIQRASFDDWRLDACPHHGPSIAIDADGDAHAVWFTASTERRGIYYSRMTGDGADRLRHIGVPPAANADIATDGRRLAVTWKDIDNGRTRLRGMLSSDAGRSWDEFVLASTAGASGQPRILCHGGTFVVFWNTQETPLSVTVFPGRDPST